MKMKKKNQADQTVTSFHETKSYINLVRSQGPPPRKKKKY